MNANLKAVFEKLEREREQILLRVAPLNEEQYRRSVLGKWSISQILTHLVTSERLALIYLKKKSQGVDSLKNSGWVESTKLILLQLSQRLPIRYRVPTSIAAHTPEALTFEALSHQWQLSRNELKSFLESIDEKHIKKLVFKHPVVGKLDIIQGVTFLREHLLHHLPQINRLLK
jgi:hypothetical protein